MSGPSARESINGNLQLDDLRSAIRENRVSFPLPVPVFARQYRADTQWRLAELYLIHGWSSAMLADRYGISRSRVRQSVRHRVHRAHTLGYLQPVSPESKYPDLVAVAGIIRLLRDGVSSEAQPFALLARAAENEMVPVTPNEARYASASGK
jgi:hypothetical protein